jgi:hypothetical protein
MRKLQNIIISLKNRNKVIRQRIMGNEDMCVNYFKYDGKQKPFWSNASELWVIKIVLVFEDLGERIF